MMVNGEGLEEVTMKKEQRPSFRFLSTRPRGLRSFVQKGRLLRPHRELVSMRAAFKPALFLGCVFCFCTGGIPGDWFPFLAVKEAQAVVLSQYTFPAATFTATTVFAGLTAGAVTNNGQPIFEVSSNGYASDPELRVAAKAGATSQATAITQNSYVYFSLTPTGGVRLNLTSLTFNIARGGASTPRGYVIRSSADNYAANIQAADVATVRPTWTAVTVDLSGAAFQNLSSTITFRIYIYTTGTTATLEIDALTVNGTVLPDVIFYGTLL
jgi:hypothetical protein